MPRSFTSALILGPGLRLGAVAACAQTLPEPATRSLDADPAVRATSASLRAADEHLFQAKGAYGPTANVTVTSNKCRYSEPQTYDSRGIRSDQFVLQVSQPL